MKKLLFPFIILLTCSQLVGNIITPKVNISEIFIESDSIWAIELLFPDHPDIIPFDSIEIETKAGKSMLASYSLIDITEAGWAPSYIAVIDKNFLDRPLKIDRQSDFVKVYSFLNGYPESDYIAFGNYEGSNFLQFEGNLSISRTAAGEFTLDNSPTIGSKNTEEGTMGVVHGFLFDKNSYPVENTDLVMFGPNAMTNGFGYYDAPVLSRTYFIEDTVIAWLNPTQTYVFVPDTIYVHPDSIVSTNIVLLSYSINSSIYNNPRRTDLRFTNFPNPFRDITTFYIYIPASGYSEANLQIFNNHGQLVASVALPPENENIALSSAVLGNLAAGCYYYTIITDGKPSGLVNTLVKLP